VLSAHVLSEKRVKPGKTDNSVFLGQFLGSEIARQRLNEPAILGHKLGTHILKFCEFRPAT
jgi:hypothetical protein